jgi:spore coat protein U-like protein
MTNKITIAFTLSLIFNIPLSVAEVSCTLGSTGLFFGLINPLSSVEIAGVGALNLNCMGGPVAYTITLSQGNGTMVQRMMKSGLNGLKYNLYTSNTHVTILGDGTAGSLPITGLSSSDSLSVAYVLYGKVSNVGLSNTVAGTYTDHIAVTITY